jgi:glycosyltransferase involved in cell wall biosynthesis
MSTVMNIITDERPQAATSFAPRAILHVAENIKGGVGAYLRDLLALQAESYGDGIVTALVPASQATMLQSPEGVEVLMYDDNAPRWLSALRLAWRTTQILAHYRPEIVHLHSTLAGAALRPLVRIIHPKAWLTYCAHGWAFDRRTGWYSRLGARLLERVLAPVCDTVICISQHEMRAAERIGIPAKRLRLIPNGIPRDSPRPRSRDVVWPEGKRRVLFVGRFDRQKGIDVLLDALEALQDSTFCYLVGDTVLGDAPLRDLPLNACATGWLFPAEIERFYRSADVVVIPSRWEGFGLNAVEAMRAELPVIASRVGGLAEVVQDGTTGVLLPPDDKAALVQALRDLDDEHLAAMGRAGRQRFLRYFTLDRVHEQITSLYQEARSR